MLGRPARSNLPSRGLWRIVDDRIIAVDRSWDGPTTVLAPSEDVLALTVDLPFPTRAQRLTHLPFAVEDAVAEPLATLHFALGMEVAPRRHIAGVVRHDRMQTWLALLAGAELGPAVLVPDALTLPLPPPGVWVVRTDGDRALVRTDNGAGFALPVAMLASAWTAADQPRIVPLGDPLPAVFAGGIADEAALLDGSGQFNAILPPLDLCQGPYAATRPASAAPLRTVALVAGLGVIAHIAILAADTLLLDRMADRKETEARALLQSVAPQIALTDDPVAVADQLLPSVSRGSRPFTRLLAQTSGALPGAGAVAFNTLAWSPGALDLTVAVADAASLDRAVAALNASGLNATGAPAGVADGLPSGGLNATLRIAPAGSR
jgi:general secretion pathway protein L